MWNDEVATALGAEVDGSDIRPVVEVTVDRWYETAAAARDTLGCNFFDWLSCVDEGDGNFRMVIHLWNLERRCGVLIRTEPEHAPIPSIVDIYAGADWHERETHEMFGTEFTGRQQLAPLLLPPEFEGHPLRKDFILASRVAKPWPGAKEPGGDHAGPRKRAPMRPPGVPAPEEWGPQATESGE